jgi:hypothetical protein
MASSSSSSSSSSSTVMALAQATLKLQTTAAHDVCKLAR